MNKISERYNTKVEIPISVILETIFSDDNHDVETLCRWAKHYEFVDLIKENEDDKLGYYKLQDDYTKQSFYICLDKEERKQYDYEDFLLDKIEEKDKEIERLNNIIDEFIDDIEDYLDSNPKVFCGDCDIYYRDLEIQDKHCEGFDFTIKMQEKINKLKELKGSDK